MPEPLQLLLLEDREDDAAMIVFELQQAGFEPELLRVDNADAFSAALDRSLDLILADYRLPDWNGLAALDMVLASGLDIPFILVSGTIGEDLAVDAMRRGAADYLLKDRLTRLGPAVRHQLENRRLRAERRAAEAARAEERRIAEEQLRESEARYRDLFENSSDIIQSVAPDGHFQYVNKAWYKTLGYDETDLAQRTIFDVISEESRAHCFATFAAVLSGKAQDRLEVDFVTKSGARIAAEGSVSCRMENGRAVAARCIFRDVTERKRAERASREASTLLRIAGSTARIGGWRIAVPPVTLILSDEICDILELPRGTSPTEKALPFYVPEWRERFWAAYEASLTEGKAFDLELEFVTAGGRRRWGRCIGEAERNEAGDIVAVQGSFQDITDRRNAEAALRASEQKYRDIIDFAPIGFYQTRIDGRFLMANRAFAEIFGYSTVDELRDIRIPEQLYPTPEARRRFLARVEREGLVAAAELLLRQKDGQPLWVEVSARALNDSSGRMVASEGFVTNIDRRKSAEQALRDSEERYRMLVESAEEVIFSLTAEAILTSVNPAFERLSGWAASDWVGRSFWELIEDADRDLVQSSWSVLLSGHPVPPTYIRVRTRGGARTIHTSAAPIVRDGKVVQITGIARDVTDERRIQREREELTARLQLVLESTDEGLYATDAHGLCTMINRSGAELLGYRPEELLGGPMHSLIHHSGPAGERASSECPAILVIKTGRSARSSGEVFWTKNGTSFPVEMACSPIFNGESVAGAVVTFTDITKRKAVERQLEQASRVDSLGRLAATMAHEFNNVLMGIQPFTEVIARRAPADEKIARATTRIQSSVKRGKTVAQEILRFTQPSRPSLQPLALAAWLQNLNAEARALMPDGIELIVGDVQAELAVIADSLQLHQAFVNVLLNAKDAMPNGGCITIDVRADDDSCTYPFGVIEQPGRYVHLTVTDTGSGMSREVINHIFEPLFTTKRSGTGIGLAVTYNIVQAHGGQIFVESEPGKGSRFHLFIPRVSGEAMLPPPAPEKLHSLPPPMRVLLVEDDPAVADGLTGVLQLAGLRVGTVDRGALALEAVERFTPDAVVLDIGLPDIDGESVYRQIAAKWPKLPVIFSTGHADQARLEHLLDRDNVACLLKPYEADALLNLLGRFGARHPSEAV